MGIPSEPSTPVFNRPGPMLNDWKWVEIMPELTRRAVTYIEKRGQVKTQPFFLYFPLTAPHFPVVPAPEFQGKSKAGEYGDFVAQVDWTVGQVLDALKRAGVAENTLVIFTSDNGPEITGEVRPGAYDRIREFGHYSMGQLRGAKRDAWEGGHREPFLVRWPGKIKPGCESSEIICETDFIATVATILGAKLPDDAGEDSYDLLPVLLGRKIDKPIREATVHHSANGHFAIRKGDWVLIDFPTGDDNKEPEWFKKERGYEPHNQPGELFRISHDLPERKNLYAENPDKVRELKALLEKYRKDGRSTPGTPQPNQAPRRAGQKTINDA
jgi:arylsulfatase A-like enzyme